MTDKEFAHALLELCHGGALLKVSQIRFRKSSVVKENVRGKYLELLDAGGQAPVQNRPRQQMQLAA